MKRPFSYRVVHYLHYGRFPARLTLKTLAGLTVVASMYK